MLAQSDERYDSAWAAFELMLASGIEPDATTIATKLGCTWAKFEDLLPYVSPKSIQTKSRSRPQGS